jgi:hypothetical protein
MSKGRAYEALPFFLLSLICQNYTILLVQTEKMMRVDIIHSQSYDLLKRKLISGEKNGRDREKLGKTPKRRT